MDFTNFTCTDDDDERRVDRVVRRILPALPLSAVYKNIRSGFIRINGKKTSSDARTVSGDVINIASFLASAPDEGSTAVPEKALQSSVRLQDVFKNEHIRVVNKPYDMPVHGGSAGQNVVSLADIIISEYRGSSLSFRPGPLHRLDRKTTGLIAFSQSLAGARWFSASLEKHVIQKTYIALLCGRIPETMVLENIITKSADKTEYGFYISAADKTASDESAAEGKDAVSILTPRFYGKLTAAGRTVDVTFAEIIIKTGRTHQIRVQCAKAGYPLLGDSAYGGVPSEAAVTAAGGVPGRNAVTAAGGVPGRNAVTAAGGCPQTESRSGIGSMKPSSVPHDPFFLHAWKMDFPLDNPIGLPACLYAPVPAEFIQSARNCLIDIDCSPYNVTVQ